MLTENLGTDVNGRVDYTLSLPSSTQIVYTALAANAEQTVTTLPNFNRAYFFFSAGANVFVGNGSTPITLPTSSFTSTTAELNPGGRKISKNGGETLRFISDIAAYVVIRYDLGA